jgi:rRNA maturation endonuclease Nob1
MGIPYEPAICTNLPVKKCSTCGKTYPTELDECPTCMHITPIKARARTRKGKKRIEDEWYKKQNRNRDIK